MFVGVFINNHYRKVMVRRTNKVQHIKKTEDQEDIKKLSFAFILLTVCVVALFALAAL